MAFSDIHLDAVTAGKSRKAEVLAFIENVFHLAQKHGADLVIFSGDAHNPGRLLDSLYAAEMIRYVFAFVRSALAPVFIAVAGNHDVIDTSELYLQSPVTTLTPLRAAAIACLAPELMRRVHVFDRADSRSVVPGWSVLGLPYISRAHSHQQPSWEDHAFHCAQRQVDEGDKLIVVGHRIVPGAVMSSESQEMARGQEQLFPATRVAALKPALVINGHYHARQTVEFEGLQIQIPGSPLRFTFGEADEVAKGVLYAELP